MNVEHIILFKNIAREHSITRGAIKSGVSQSAASQHVHELERSLATELLDRSTRPLELTEAGKLYYQYCLDALRRKDDFDVSLDRLKQQVEGSVRVASIYSVGLSETSRLEEDFQRSYPEAELKFNYLRSEKVYEAVLADSADLGLVSYPVANKEIKAIHWRDEVMVVTVKPDHPLAANAFLRPSQLQNEEFVGFDTDLPIARELGRFFKEHGVSVNTVLRFDNVIMIKEAVMLGSRISILPERVITPDLEKERLTGIPLQSPGLYRPLGIIHHRRKRFNRATRAFLEMLQRQPARATPVKV